MTNELDKLASAVRILELEERKLTLENRIACMKAEHSVDEGCVGCAGPCKVVDVSANPQKELDECSHTNSFLHEELGAIMGQLADSRNRCGYLSTELGLREAELFDLKNSLPDNFWAVVTERDSMIRRQGKIIEDFKTIETRETDRLHKTIDELKDQNIKDLKELYDLDKEDIDKRDKMIEKQGREISGLMCLRDMYDGLEAELSARKEDSAVLMKVVEAVRRYDSNELVYAADVLRMIYPSLEDYLNAPEVPPETPIEEDQDIAIVFTYGEIL